MPQLLKIGDALSHARPPAAILIALAWALTPSRILVAGEVYKSVDSEGHVVYSDRPDVQGAKPLVPIEDVSTPPGVMHFCWTNCFTLEFRDGRYRRTDGTDETWTVERFNPQSIVLHRHDAPADWNGRSTDVVYAGQVSEDRLINVTVNGRPTAGVIAAWGAALDTLPANNAERDRRQADVSMTAGGAAPTADGDAATASTDVDLGDSLPSVAEAPPPLPDEDQPVLGEDGYLWTPGYWVFGTRGYHWARGVWAMPPGAGLLWTPGYWGFEGGAYVFHRGYWGEHVGYYGGINYGFGYGGAGYQGGRWVGKSFAYNRSVSHVNESIIHDTYREPVVNQTANSRASYNGGPAGTRAVPTAAEMAAAKESHITPAPPPRHLVQNPTGQSQPGHSQPGQSQAGQSQVGRSQLVHIEPMRRSTPSAPVVAQDQPKPAALPPQPHSPPATPRARPAQTAGGAPVVSSEPRILQAPASAASAASAPAPARETAAQPGAPKALSVRPTRAEPASH